MGGDFQKYREIILAINVFVELNEKISHMSVFFPGFFVLALRIAIPINSYDGKGWDSFCWGREVMGDLVGTGWLGPLVRQGVVEIPFWWDEKITYKRGGR